jgi:hypothetical protein
LAALGKPESVRPLAIRLHLSGWYVGGSESKASAEHLRQSLVKALASCTGLDFPNYDPAGDADTPSVVKRCQDWLEGQSR